MDGYAYLDGDYEELLQLLIRHLYANSDIFLFLLTKSQGTAFENCIDEIVEKIEKGYRIMAKRMAEKILGMQMNSYMLHWMMHMNIDAFIC